MDSEYAFSYTYSAKANQEVLNIRSKYLPKKESKLEELKRLDHTVQSSGVVMALCSGIGGALVFGVGFCLTIKVFGNAFWLGVILELLGMTGVIFAYPFRRMVFRKTKAKYTPRILELTAELTHTEHK